MWKLPRAKRVPKTSSKRSSLMVWFPSPPSPSHSRLYSIDSHRISLFRKHGGKSMESSVVSHAGSQADVEIAACQKGAKNFVQEVISHGLVPFATKPITLKALLNRFTSDQSLPQTRREIYGELCRIACGESSRCRNCRVPKGGQKLHPRSHFSWIGSLRHQAHHTQGFTQSIHIGSVSSANTAGNLWRALSYRMRGVKPKPKRKT